MFLFNKFSWKIDWNCFGKLWGKKSPTFWVWSGRVRASSATPCSRAFPVRAMGRYLLAPVQCIDSRSGRTSTSTEIDRSIKRETSGDQRGPTRKEHVWRSCNVITLMLQMLMVSVLVRVVTVSRRSSRAHVVQGDDICVQCNQFVPRVNTDQQTFQLTNTVLIKPIRLNPFSFP